MTKEEMFFGAKWVCAGEYASTGNEVPDANGTPHFPVLRGKFTVSSGDRVTLRVVGLGFFHCYVNGKEVTTQKYLPLATDYEPRNGYPSAETLFGHRLYVPQFDVTDLVHDGENTVAVHFGGGWYTYEVAGYGDPKAIYDIAVENADGVRHFGSSEKDKIGDGFVKTYYFITSENHDYTDFDDACFGNGFDDTAWQNAVLAAPLETEYLQTNCPCDAEMQEIPFEFLGEKNGEKVYRCAQNISGYPVIRLHAKRGETVKIAFDETINPDFSFSNKEDPTHTFMQTMEIVADGQERIIRPQFTWFGFQYFKIKGEATPEKVVFVYSAVEETGEFSSDQKTLNWIYRAYVDSQLGNMHAGIPSDCPHFERRGYTGDGQLTAPAAMKTIGAKAFYRKWIEDISDSQDRISGHAQYVVPLHYGGGGPGGWGCAIVEVPYQYYKHYGDIAPFKKMYAQMLHWFDFMQNHSENGIVTSDIPGNWCLGEWVTPEPVTIPEGFVNTYFYIRSMQRCLELLPVIGATQDETALTDRIEACKKAMNTAFFNAQTESYADGVQGADAFALDIGLGTEKTLQNLVERYTALGHFDTGIFGTEILPRVLFEKGYGNLALQLLITDHPTSFETWRKQGLTTLGENWPSSPFQRSYNHPMFGAVVSHFYTYLLGIRQKPTAGGYTEISIDPCFCEELNAVSGSMMTANGRLTVSYEKQNGGVQVEIDLPPETKARLTVGEKTFALKNGKNSISAENY